MGPPKKCSYGMEISKRQELTEIAGVLEVGEISYNIVYSIKIYKYIICIFVFIHLSSS